MSIEEIEELLGYSLDDDRFHRLYALARGYEGNGDMHPFPPSLLPSIEPPTAEPSGTEDDR